MPRTPKNIPQNNFLSTFIEHAANTGYQRTNRYIVFIQGPPAQAVIDRSVYEDPSLPVSRKPEDMARNNVLAKKFLLTNNPAYMRPMDLDASRRLAINCTSATLAGKSLSTVEFGSIGSGPPSRFPYAETFTNEVTLDFNCSLDFFERKYFISWLNSIVDTQTHDVALYEDYAKPFKILMVMLPPDVMDFQSIEKFKNEINTDTTGFVEGGNGVKRSIYYVRLQEVYPVEIYESKVDYEDTNIMKVSVKFNYRYWDDPVSVYMSNIRFSHENGNNDIIESPFDRFKKILRDIVRWSDPQALKQDLIEKGLQELGDIVGVENVEHMAQAGQIIDVYSQSPDKNSYQTIQNKLIRPMGGLLN